MIVLTEAEFQAIDLVGSPYRQVIYIGRNDAPEETEQTYVYLCFYDTVLCLPVKHWELVMLKNEELEP